MPKNALLVPGMCLVLFAACFGGNEQAELKDAEYRVKASDLSEEDTRSLNFVRRVVERYKDVSLARAAGYIMQYPEGCVQSGAGSQGIHLTNAMLLDGKAQMNRPEMLMYEPQPDGSMVLVGIDYVVPFDQWTGKDAPQLIGRNFVRNESLKAWTLHVWTHRMNPNGVFAMYNPHVICRSSLQTEAAAQSQ